MTILSPNPLLSNFLTRCISTFPGKELDTDTSPPLCDWICLCDTR